MNSQKLFFVTLLALAFCALPASAAITVSTPTNGSTVPTQFPLTATAPSCSSQPVAAMGYSFDYSTNTSIVYSTSINTTVTATTGTHTLHVKAWGNAGAVCVTDLSLTVSSTLSTSGTISVTSPLSGATVSSPFVISASTTGCSSQTVAAMGYSVDYGPTTIVYATSFNASAAATVGAHTLHVKVWGNGGAVCVKDVPINVSSGTSSLATLSVNSSSIAFGSVALNTTFTQTLTLTSTGTSAVTVSGISITGTGFSYSGVSLPLTLNPGQTATLYVMFNTATTTAVSGQLIITSNSSTGSQTTIALSGSGSSTTHSVNLSWLAPTSSPDPVKGYLVLRALSGGSYSQINSSTLTQTSFVDSSVQSGKTYTYMVESVGTSGAVSSPAGPVTATIP